MHIMNAKMASENDQSSAPRSPTENTNKLMESVGIDSGFLSSGACTTESDLSASCDLGLGASCSSSISTSAVYNRLDSGVDVSDQLSQMNLSSDSFLNEKLPKVEEFPTKTIEVNPKDYPPWEYFFNPDEDGDTQLHIAIIKGFTEAACTLISLVPSPIILDCQNDFCQTSLHLSVLSKQPFITRRLVAAGARVDIRDRNGNTPLHLAAQNGDLNNVQALTMALSVAETQICQLAYPSFAQSLPQQLNITNYDGQAPIHLAAQNGHCDVIRSLVWLGANINLTEGKAGRTPLHYAVERGYFETVRCLIECGSNLESENYSRLTAYQIASEINTKIASDLVRFGAVPLPPQAEETMESDSDSDVPN